MLDATSNSAICGRFSNLRKMGFNVIPVVRNSKMAAVKWKDHQNRWPTDDEIDSWDNSDYNVAVVTGKLSNLAVFDVDGPDAQARLDSLNLPRTPIVKTGKGHHYYFRLDDAAVPNKVDIEGIKLDVRGEGGYVVAPGSVHENGSAYEWEISPEETPLAPIPANLLALLAPKSMALAVRSTRLTPESTAKPGRFDRFLASELDKAVKRVSELVEGGRNNGLFANAVHLAGHVAAAEADWSRFASRLQASAVAVGLGVQETDATLASAWLAACRLSQSWIVQAKEWIYVGSSDSFFHVRTGEQLSPIAFNRTHAALNPFDHGKLSENLMSGGYLDIVQNFTFDPSKERGVFERDGLLWFNNYRPTDIQPIEGDPRPFTDFLEYLIHSSEEREHLLKMIAWTVQNPDKKLRHALLLTSAAQGIGKSILVDIWRSMLGAANTRKTTSDEISGAYQSFIKDKVLVVVEELNLGVGPKAYNSLKDLITGDVVAINEKYERQREYPNYASFVFLSNLGSPMIIEASDRRFFFIKSEAQPRDKAYYSTFCEWWQGNLGVIAGFLRSIDLTDFDRSAPPPETGAKADLRADSVPALDQELLALLSDRRGPFARDIGTIEDVRDALPPVHRAKSLSQIGSALKRIGAQPLDQMRVAGRWSTDFFMLGGKVRISPWAFRNVDHWSAASTSERAAEYGSRDGTLDDPDNASVVGADRSDLINA